MKKYNMKYKKCFNCGSAEIDSTDEMVLCKECGYHVMNLFTELSTDYKNKPTTDFDMYLLHLPKLVQDLRKFDKNKKLYWLPFILNVYPVGIVYPNGTSVDNWKWCYAPYKPIPISERKNYPKEDNSGDFYEYTLDVEKEQSFDVFSKGLKLLKM